MADEVGQMRDVEGAQGLALKLDDLRKRLVHVEDNVAEVQRVGWKAFGTIHSCVRVSAR